MKHTQKQLSPTRLSLSIILDAADLAQVRPTTIASLAKNVKVAGFRPGKVPASVAAKQLDPVAVDTQLTEDAINHFAAQVVEAEQIQPLDRPRVSIDNLEPGRELAFTVEIDILPAVKLGNYKKLKATKEKVAVSTAEINETINRMRQSHAKKKEVTRAAKDGDELTIDFRGMQDGVLLPGTEGTDYPLVLGSGSFIPGFEAGLIGKKAGDEIDLPVTFPADYHHAPLADQHVVFHITVNTVKEISLPPVDDDFAKKAGDFQTVDELQADVKRELTVQKNRQADDALRDSLIEQLVTASDVPVSEILVNDQIESLERDATQNLMYRGQSVEQLLEAEGIDRETWREREFREAAIRRVKVGLLLAELSKTEKIEVATDEMEARLQQLLEQYTDSKFREQIDTPEARRDIANRLLTEKTVERLVELNSKG